VRSWRCHTQRTPAGEIDSPRRFRASETRTWPLIEFGRLPAGSAAAWRAASGNLCLPRHHPLLRVDPGRPVHREAQDAEQAADAQADGAAPGGVTVDAANPFLRARWRGQKRLLGGTSIGTIASKKFPPQARLIFDATLIAGDQIWFGNEDQKARRPMSDDRACFFLGADIVPGAGQPRHGPLFESCKTTGKFSSGWTTSG
jgi:hypothetical protein